jgi:hypothetical protein
VIEGFLAWERGEVKTRRQRSSREQLAAIDPWLRVIDHAIPPHGAVPCREVHEIVASDIDRLPSAERQEVYTRVGYIMKLLGWTRMHMRRSEFGLGYFYFREYGGDSNQLKLFYEH